MPRVWAPFDEFAGVLKTSAIEIRCGILRHITTSPHHQAGRHHHFTGDVRDIELDVSIHTGKRSECAPQAE